MKNIATALVQCMMRMARGCRRRGGGAFETVLGIAGVPSRKGDATAAGYGEVRGEANERRLNFLCDPPRSGVNCSCGPLERNAVIGGHHAQDRASADRLAARAP